MRVEVEVECECARSGGCGFSGLWVLSGVDCG